MKAIIRLSVEASDQAHLNRLRHLAHQAIEAEGKVLASSVHPDVDDE